MKAGGPTVKEGEMLSMDGTAGEVYSGDLDPHPSEIQQVLVEKTLQAAIRRSTNCSPADEVGRQDPQAEGAHQRRHAERLRRGPGLRRRGHRPLPHRAHVLRRGAHRRGAADDPGRGSSTAREALAKLLPMQRKDFVGIFKAMDGLPVTIRLLDPPLHEFLPTDENSSRSWRRRWGFR